MNELVVAVFMGVKVTLQKLVKWCLYRAVDKKKRNWRVIAGDVGAGSVIVAGLVAVALVLSLAVLGLSQVMTARVKAQIGADMASIAAAQALHEVSTLSSSACEAALILAQRNQVKLTYCVVIADDVLVKTQSGTAFVGFKLNTEARSRAGPTTHDF